MYAHIENCYDSIDRDFDINSFAVYQRSYMEEE